MANDLCYSQKNYDGKETFYKNPGFLANFFVTGSLQPRSIRHAESV
jgi:hypothetical protein